MSDAINPDHYKTDTGIEAIDVIEAFFPNSPHLANAFKYMARLDKKHGDWEQELDKTGWYLDRYRTYRRDQEARIQEALDQESRDQAEHDEANRTALYQGWFK